MRRRVLLIPCVLTAITLIIVVAVLVTPRAFSERPSFSLLGSQTPPWQQAYCVPEGTLVAFTWHTNDGSSLTLRVLSASLLTPYQYSHSGSDGSGSLYFYGSENFVGLNATSGQVVIEVGLSFSVNGTLLSGPAPFGPC